jgi:hypothetical protein
MQALDSAAFAPLMLPSLALVPEKLILTCPRIFGPSDRRIVERLAPRIGGSNAEGSLASPPPKKWRRHCENYQEQAAKLDHGELPDIGEDEPFRWHGT